MAALWDRYRRGSGLSPRIDNGNWSKTKYVGLPINMDPPISTKRLSMLKFAMDMSLCAQFVTSKKEAMHAKYSVHTSKIVSFETLLMILS